MDDAAAVEAIGRNAGAGMWGWEDSCRDGGWVAFTTDPLRHDLAWVVRWHPEHGRSVVVYRNENASTIHTILRFEEPTALVFRASGYWWDGVATRGAGAANLAIGVHTARQDSTPMLALLGQVETDHLGKEAFQEVDLGRFLRRDHRVRRDRAPVGSRRRGRGACPHPGHDRAAGAGGGGLSLGRAGRAVRPAPAAGGGRSEPARVG